MRASEFVTENFADKKVKGRSRPGRVKRSGASCKGSVTDLRARAKKYGGERGRMYQWCLNMKSGRQRTNEDNAVARMHLAGICAQTGRRQEALNLLADAKKHDKNGMLKDQIKMLQQQLQMAPSKNQMRIAQMMGGRKKTPKMR